MPAVLSIVSDRVKFSQFRLSASIASSLIFPFHLRAGIRLHSLIRAPEPSSLAAQDSVQSHTRSHRPGSRRTKPAKTHYTTSFIKSHTKGHEDDENASALYRRSCPAGVPLCLCCVQGLFLRDQLSGSTEGKYPIQLPNGYVSFVIGI